MLSRVRLDAFGATAAEVENILYSHADHIENLLGIAVSRGEAVIERSLKEPDGMFAWEGRLVLHPDVSRRSADPAAPLHLVGQDPIARARFDWDEVSGVLYSPARHERAGDGTPVRVAVENAQTDVWMSPDATVWGAVRTALMAQGVTGEPNPGEWEIVSDKGTLLAWGLPVTKVNDWPISVWRKRPVMDATPGVAAA